jgi:hypothetical protein
MRARDGVEAPLTGRSWRVVVVTVVVAAVVVGAVVLFGGRGSGARSYEPGEVVDALRAQGLDMRAPQTKGATGGMLYQGAFIEPVDGSFTVLVLPTDREAAVSFRPYEADTDPDTFELRAGNVLFIADYSNRDTPLSRDTRRRIRRAVAALDSR